MKRTKLILSLAIGIGLAGSMGYGLYTAGVRQGQMTAPPASDHRTSDKKVLYWHDPMVPGQKFDKPGKSPFMDMQLVPVYADGAAEGAADGSETGVAISARVQQNLGIRTAAVETGPLATPLVAVGTVAYNERDVALVQARANGYVERLYVRANLDPVKQGQPLAELYVPDWIAAQEEYLTVKRMGSKPGTEGLLDGARQRMRLIGMTEPQIRMVESSGKVQPRVTVTAPTSGIVGELAAREGMTVAAGAPLFRINGIGTVWIDAEIPEQAVAQVRVGAQAEGSAPALPGVTFKGTVSALLPEVNPATRTVKARIELANTARQLLPGMFVTVTLRPSARHDVMLVPSEAVIRTGTRNVVMTALGNGTFRPVDVETGVEADGKTEIRKGLEPGQRVVVSGQFLVDSEASLRVTANHMDGGPPAGGADNAAGAPYRASGRIEQIGADEITISHGPVAALHWGPMTMGFQLPQGGLPSNLAVGDKVVFEFRPAAGGKFRISSISATADAPAHSAQTGGRK
jgi:Cu(I)/Ag(I) efflux system membrane fusion protein